MNATNEGMRITDDLRKLVGEAEALLRATAKGGNGEIQERAQATLRDLRLRMNALQENLRLRAGDVDTYVHENPWQAVAAVGGVALLLGLLMGGLGRR
jgi:ElaB/YqjD/DUF883 family membrane-anchored ribosome-binding protein